MDEKKKSDMSVNINLDTTPILYTDNIFMTVNEDGVVLDIAQKLGPTNQIRIVSRIGMSKDHARKFLKEMGKLLVMNQGQIETGRKN